MKLLIKKIKVGLVLMATFLLTDVCQAQVDTVFWFVVPEVSSTHADRPIYFQIATLGNPSTVTISIPAAGITMVNNVTIPANSSQSFDVTAYIDDLETPNDSTNDHINEVLNKGVLITATEYITAYYEVLGTVYPPSGPRIVNTDIFALKGANALGTEFYVPFQNVFPNVHITDWAPIDTWSSIDIVATEDNTNITVYPTQPYRVGASGSSTAPISITLNRGQTYTIEAKGILGAEHLSGTRIVSDKKIAVTMKDDSIGQSNAHDLAGDQIIPVNRTGTEYIVFGGYAFITATEDNTTISVGGVDQGVSLSKGQTHAIDLMAQTNAVHIVTSEKAYMNHLIRRDAEMGNAVMPPLQCTGSRSVTVNRSSANFGEIFYLYITVEAGSEDDFVVTNSLFPTGTNTVINGADFQPVAGTGGAWLFDTLAFPYNALNEIPLGGNIIANTTGIFHLGILNGKGITTNGVGDQNQATGYRYGYFTDFGNLTISLNIPDQCIAQGDSVQIYPGDFVKYEWSTGSTDTAIYVKQSGNFSIEVTDANSCSVTEDFHVQLDQVPEFDLGPDIIVCGEQEVVLRTYNSNFAGLSNVSFSWNNGGADSIHSVYHSGTYTLTATNGCGNKAESVDVHMIPITTNNLFTPNGDGLNETFVLDGLDVIGEWELIVYNRWGERVYKADLYKNEWNGLNVIEGVYYYYFNDKSDQCPEKKGWVQIVK